MPTTSSCLTETKQYDDQKLKNLELEGSDADGKTKTVKLRDIPEIEKTQTAPVSFPFGSEDLSVCQAGIDEAHNVTLVTQEAERLRSSTFRRL